MTGAAATRSGGLCCWTSIPHSLIMFCFMSDMMCVWNVFVVRCFHCAACCICTDSLASVPRDTIRCHQSCHGECWGAAGAGESPKQQPGLWWRPMRQRLPADCLYISTFLSLFSWTHHFTGCSPDFLWRSTANSESTEDIFIWQIKQYFDNDL